jgi:hypothetical protein
MKVKLPSMGATVAECGRSLSAWTGVKHRNPRIGNPSIGSITDSLQTVDRILIAFFAPTQLRLMRVRLDEDVPGATRVEAGRRRARAAKRAVAFTAATGFAVVLALARQGHPATGTSTTRTVQDSAGSSSSSATRQGGSSLGGGSLAPSTGASPPAATHTS